jgi:hypothetical protein
MDGAYDILSAIGEAIFLIFFRFFRFLLIGIAILDDGACNASGLIFIFEEW